MRNLFRLSFTAFAFFIFTGLTFINDAKAQGGPLAEITKRMDAHNKALTSLKANVMMEKYNAQLDTIEDSDRYSGKVIYLTNKGLKYVRIDWSKPVEESLAVIDKDYMVYTPRNKRAICGNVNSAKGSGGAGNAFAFINMSKAQLQANYSVKYVGQENISGGTATWRIQLTPKTAAGYKLADLWVDSNGMPVQSKITSNNNDTTTVLLSGLEKNIQIRDGSIFKINLPKDVKCVKG